MSKKLGPNEARLRAAREAQAGAVFTNASNGSAPTTALVIPDPRLQPVPPGWFESFAPVAEGLSWEELDEAEGQLLAFASYIESFGGDVVEFEKALRIVERRRGMLLGDPQQGKKLPPCAAEVSEGSRQRYRTIARAWNVIWKHLLNATRRRDVTQAEVIRVARRATVRAELETAGALEAKKLAGTYDVIVIDPPWPVVKIERDVRENQTGFDYPTMTVDELAALDVPCADDCHVWVWATQKYLPSAFQLLDAWGLKYVCTFVWHKPGGFQPFGLPQYNCEFALYARKGVPAFVDTKAFDTAFNAPRGAHSEKPEEFYDVVRRVTAGRRLDMFNRRRIEGFDGWGKEAA